MVKLLPLQTDQSVDLALFLNGIPIFTAELNRSWRTTAKRLAAEAARGPEVREPELAARVLDAVAQHVEGAAPGDLAGEPREEARLHVGAVVLPELLPLLGLGGEEEVDDVGRDLAEGAVVVLRPAPVVAARGRVVAECGRGSRTAATSPGQASGPWRSSAHSMAASKARSEMSGVMGR